MKEVIKAIRRMSSLAKNDPLAPAGKTFQKPQWLTQMQSHNQPTTPVEPKPPKAIQPQKINMKNEGEAMKQVQASTDPNLLLSATSHPSFMVRHSVLKNPNTPPQALVELYKKGHGQDDLSWHDMSNHANFTPKAFEAIHEHEVGKYGEVGDSVFDYIASNRPLTEKTFNSLASGEGGLLVRGNKANQQLLLKHPSITYDGARSILDNKYNRQSDQLGLEIAAASNHRAPNLLLTHLSSHQNPAVRIAVGSNPYAPHEVHTQLMNHDPDPKVREAAALGFNRLFDQQAK